MSMLRSHALLRLSAPLSSACRVAPPATAQYRSLHVSAVRHNLAGPYSAPPQPPPPSQSTSSTPLSSSSSSPSSHTSLSSDVPIEQEWADSLRPAASQPTAHQAATANHYTYKLPPLPYDAAQGIPGLFAPAAMEIAWTQYMQYTLIKLSHMTAGNAFEGKTPLSLIAQTAREPSLASLFNHASMAYNHHFFFRSLSPNPPPMPLKLKGELEASFGSMATLRQEFLVTASAMFGPGFVWLVKTGPATYGILCTYQAGSPFPAAHWRRQSVDLSTLGSGTSAEAYLKASQAGASSSSSAAASAAFPASITAGVPPPNGNAQIVPVLCISTWEHAWLPQFGVSGKLAYIRAWWDKIDWETVNQVADSNRPRVSHSQYAH